MSACLSHTMIKKYSFIFGILVAIITCVTTKNIAFSENSPPEATITIQKGVNEATVPFSVNVDGSSSIDPEGSPLIFFWQFPDKTYNTKNPRSYRFTEAGQYKITLTVTDVGGLSDSKTLEINALPKIKKQKTSSKSSSATYHGNLSDKISLTEILPNPEGKDPGNEWLEIFNGENFSIDISGWQLESGDKTKTLSQTIPPGYSLIKNINLKNSTNTVIFKDFNGKVFSELDYDSAPEGQSLSLINNEYIWGAPTPSAPNPHYQNLTGTVTSAPTKENQYFTLDTTTIYLDEKFPYQLAKVLIGTGATMEIEIEKQEEKYFLRQIVNVTPAPSSKTKTHPYTKYYLLIPIGLSAYLLAKTTSHFLK